MRVSSRAIAMPTTRYEQVLTVAVDCNDRAAEQVLFQQTVAAECAANHCRLDLAKTRLSRYPNRRYDRGTKRFQGFLTYPHAHSQRILGNATGSDGSKRAKHATRRTQNRRSRAGYPLSRRLLQPLLEPAGEAVGLVDLPLVVDAEHLHLAVGGGERGSRRAGSWSVPKASILNLRLARPSASRGARRGRPCRRSAGTQSV